MPTGRVPHGQQGGSYMTGLTGQNVGPTWLQGGSHITSHMVGPPWRVPVVPHARSHMSNDGSCVAAGWVPRGGP